MRITARLIRLSKHNMPFRKSPLFQKKKWQEGEGGCLLGLLGSAEQSMGSWLVQSSWKLRHQQQRKTFDQKIYSKHRTLPHLLQESLSSDHWPATTCAPDGAEFISKFRDEELPIGWKEKADMQSRNSGVGFRSKNKLQFRPTSNNKRIPQKQKYQLKSQIW